MELGWTPSQHPSGCSWAFPAGEQRVKELHLDKHWSLKLKLPRSLSESRASEVSIVNKCHPWTNSKPEYGSKIGASGCHQATGTKKARSTAQQRITPSHPTPTPTPAAPTPVQPGGRAPAPQVPPQSHYFQPQDLGLGEGGGVQKALFGKFGTI